MFDRAAEIIRLIIGPPGKPPAQPRTGFVPDTARRQAKLQADARLIYRPWSPCRATPAPGPPPPMPRVPLCCPRCALPRLSCVCPTR